MTDSARGRFVWHELITPSGAGSHEFYSRVAGWGKQGWEHDASYSMFVAPSGPLGAAVERPGATPHWLAYIGVPDVDATVSTALRLGAAVLTPPTSIPNAGRHAVLADPQGATFAVHGSTMEPSPERPAAPGEFSWHELATTVDPLRAFEFYRELFGWQDLRRHDMGPMGTYLIFGRNGVQQGGMFNKGDRGRPGPGYWLCYVQVPNLDDAVAKAKAARGSLLQGPSDVPGGDRVAQLTDPHGAFFALHWVASSAASRQPAKAPRRAAKKSLAKSAKNAKSAKKSARKKKAAKVPKRKKVTTKGRATKRKKAVRRAKARAPARKRKAVRRRRR